MTNRIDLVEWIQERLAELIEEASITIESISIDSVKVVGKNGAAVLVTTDPSTAGADKQPRILVGRPSDEPSLTSFVDVLPQNASKIRAGRAVIHALELDMLRQIEMDQRRGLRRREYEVDQLIEIGKSLSAVRDVDKLLEEILAKARFLAGADAGSIYVVEGEAYDIKNRALYFKLSKNDSLTYKSTESAFQIDLSSIAGAAAVMKKTVNIPDVHKIPADAPYTYDPTSDERTGYHTRSILAVPMVNLEGEVLGVVELINKKRTPGSRLLSAEDVEREVIPMDEESQELVETLASQAGIAMENAFLYAEIQRILDGFVRASVHAIEQRDPTTSGHSFRVAALTRRLAEVVSGASKGPYNGVTFNENDLKEIETAAVLHDFGKISVREEILVKAKKLYPPVIKMIRSRFDFIRRSIENDHLHRRLMMIEQGTPNEELAILDQASERAIGEIEDCWRIIRAANEPTVLQEGDFAKIEEIARRSYFDIGGQRQPFLTPEEVTALQTAKGSLTPEELDEIRSHAAHSISFLKQIPWNKAMRHIPDWAGAHHEKLNGSGYPNKLTGDQIPLPAKIMAVADIFDALTAADRPYKKAVPVDRALNILEMEVKDRNIDGELVRLFKDNKVYEVVELHLNGGNNS
jgi:HD-GYP domain-containing protein (c-di-GMP phosphodiesterase class II)